MGKITLTYPDTWLTISIVVKKRDWWVAHSGNMREISSWVYVYDFAEVWGTDYIYTASCTWYNDMSGVLYFDDTGSYWWFSLNYSTINNHTTKKIKEAKEELEKKIDEIPKVSLDNLESWLDETRSELLLAQEGIITRIKETEINLWDEIKEENTKTRELITKKTDKVVKFATKQLDTMERIEKEIEDTENEIKEEFERIESEEKEISDLFDEYDKDEEEIRSEFEKLESNN